MTLHDAAVRAKTGSASDWAPFSLPPHAGLLQRKCTCGGTPGPGGECAACKARRLGLQRRALGAGAPATTPSAAVAPPIVHEVLRAPGQPLDAATRAYMEPRFGHDFGKVRVHSDARAAESAQAVNALAYTVGQHVTFGAGHYAPSTTAGQRLLAHELTHVLQQRAGSHRTQAQLAVCASTDAIEREADVVAEMMAGNGKHSAYPISRMHTVAPLLQRTCGTDLGAPTPDCQPAMGDASGEIFEFNVNCDEPAPDEATTHLASFLPSVSGGVAVAVHGYASMDGSARFNMDLSCHRANKMADLLRAAASPPTIVGIYKHGATPGPASIRRAAWVQVLGTGPMPPGPAPAPTPPTPVSTCIPTAGFPPSRCSEYLANSWWLPLAYVNNATCACVATPNDPTANCVRKFLQDRLAATPTALKLLAASMKQLELSPLPGTYLEYQTFVQGYLTPRIYKDHFDAYASCCCTAPPAPYYDWIGVTTVPIQPCSIVGEFIDLFGSCHGTPGAW